MVTVQSIIRPQASVVYTEMNEEEAVIWHMDIQEMFTLNVTGIRIWKGIQEELSVSAISQRLMEEFEVEEARATTSVITLIQKLLARDLVTIQEPA
ncbi:MAG: PqqD family protein [Nitrospirales bacterium]